MKTISSPFGGGGAQRRWGRPLGLALLLFPSIVQAAQPRALVARFDGIISPVAKEFLIHAVDQANRDHYDVVVIELDTPGGLDTSMRDIVKSILASTVPVVTYVYPSGARAASAGVFIAMASHVAAMAPGTNIGAAHPVMIGGGGLGGGKDKDEKDGGDKTMEAKVVNDASAYLKSIAHERRRNEDWATQAVRMSTSTAAEDAVALKIVDLTAKDLPALLDALDGREVPGLPGTLHTKGALVTQLEMTERQKFLAMISDPNVALMLMSIGSAGILIEIYNPGLIFPGVVGVVSLILGMYAFQTLSVNIAGLMLILFGFLLFLLEIKITSYGLLTVGGAVAFVLGVMMLFSTQPTSGLSISWSIVFSSLAGLLTFVTGVAWLTWKVQKLKPVTGAEGLRGAEGTAKSRLDPKGDVFVLGETWNAESVSGPIEEGAAVIVEEVKGLHLKVRKA